MAFDGFHVPVEHSEVVGGHGFAERGEALVLQDGAHGVDLPALLADAVEGWFDAFGGGPFAALLVDVEPVGEALPAVAEASGLGLVDLVRVRVVQHELVSVSVEQVLDGLVADDDDVAALAVGHVFGDPRVAEGHVRGLGEHVVAVVARVVLEVAEPPVRGGQLRRARDNLRRV